jgi:hypothetical protein
MGKAKIGGGKAGLSGFAHIPRWKKQRLIMPANPPGAGLIRGRQSLSARESRSSGSSPPIQDFLRRFQAIFAARRMASSMDPEWACPFPAIS